MNRTVSRTIVSALSAVCCLGWLVCAVWPAHGATTGWNQDTVGPFDYNTAGNWVGGSINGVWDPSLSIPSSQTITFGADTILSTGWNFGYDGNSNEILRGTGADRTITLGGDILHNTVVSARTITVGSSTLNQGLLINLGGVARNITVTSGRTLNIMNAVSNGSLVVNGGTTALFGNNTYSGTTTLNSGVLNMDGPTGNSASSDFTVNASATSSSILAFRSDANGEVGTTRVKSVTLNGVSASAGAALNVVGNATANNVETITNALTASAGYAQVTLSTNAARNTQLAAGSFVRSAGSTVLFRGADLGVSTIASQTAGDTNIKFTAAPGLVGGGGAANSSTISILKGAFGEISATATGATGGLVTYDATYGVRLLNSGTEYTTAITNGQTQLDNVLYSRVSGGASQDINLTAANSTLNSLSFKITGAGTNSGVTISGDPGTTLKLNSGSIFASQVVTTAVATDAMTISVPKLDLNGQEGVFIVFTAGVNNGNTPAPLQINSEITNGNGVTIGGTGEVIYGGAVANSYGVTTINSGILRLNKTAGGNIGLNGDLIMNGGTLLKNSNAIVDTASVTINGGTFWMDSTTSSGNNGHSETITNLTMNGGGLGNHGTSAALTMLGNLTLNASQLGMNQGGDITVNGNTTLNGGLLLARESTSTSTYNGVVTLNTLGIVNQAADSYTAMTLNSHATNKGAVVFLNGDVTFTGNGTNANTVLIDSSNIAEPNQGFIGLEGTRTFNIGNGAANVDLRIIPTLANGVGTGGLTKTGAGTLALSGANTYTGATLVSNGTLQIDGSLTGTSGVTVSSGAHLGGTGTINAAAGGAGSIDPGSSPGILTMTQVNPSGGMDFNFEFNLKNSLPTWATTENDVLRLTGATPFTQAMSLGNVMSLYIDVPVLNNGDVLLGGFYTDGGNFLTDLAGGSIAAYLENALGSVSYMGKNYDAITNGFFTVNTVANSQFAGGGFLTQFSFTAYPIPEPSTAWLLGLGVLLLRKRRRAC